MWSVSKAKCLRCGACVTVCPAGALELAENGPILNERKCTRCGTCARVCPVGAIKVV